MTRYFLELAYKGTRYSGFQSQHNANTIQAEIEKALAFFQKEKFKLTGSSRTDAGVHAKQNFFHFDALIPITEWKGVESEANLIYKLNAILPPDIVVKSVFAVNQNAHCRFDALSREYKYYIYRYKDPFKSERAFYFPYKLDIEKLQRAALMLKEHNDFTSFSKRNTQVKNFICQIFESRWVIEEDMIVYNVVANRFLRGMVRALTATMLQVGRNKISLENLKKIIDSKDCTMASFAVPAHGLFLYSVNY